MKNIFVTLSLISTLLFACSSPSGEQTAKTSDHSDAMPEKAETPANSKTDSMDHSKMSDTEQAKSSKDIHLVSPESGEVPMGDAEIVVHVDKDNLTPDDVSVEVSMPMEGQEDMTSLALVESGDQAQEFKIKTNFGMAGPWTVSVKAKDAEPATLAFNVK